MSAEFEELYQQVILDHSKRPRNFGTLEGNPVRVDGDNPSCGDEIHLQVRFSPDGGVEDLKFTGCGCAISQASASLMTLKLKGKSNPESRQLLAAFEDLVTEGRLEPPKSLGDLRLLAGVRKFPQRVKCAMLAWRAFEQALHSLSETSETSDTPSAPPHSTAQPVRTVSTEESAPHCP
jgi:nitrogen fixation NifU-like protein